MEALCPVGNKSSSNPKSLQRLVLTHIFRSWVSLRFISHSFWNHMCLTWPDDLRKTYLGSWVLNSLLVPSSLSLTVIPAKPLGCPAAETGLRLLTSYHQCHASVLLMWRKGTGTGHRLPSHNKWWNCACNLGEALEKKGFCSPFHVKVNGIVMALGILEKTFGKSSTAWHTPATQAKVSKIVAMVGTAAWLRDITLFNSW